MHVVKQDKKRFDAFIQRLVKTHEVIAPRERDLVRFEAVTQADQIHLEKQSYFPVKEYFFKKSETLFRFNQDKLSVPKQDDTSRVFFGLRRCDLNAIKHQDMVFIQGSHDPYYMAARKNSTLIGYHCEKAPHQYCFCNSMNLTDFFDLMYYDRGTHFLVEVGSEKGAALIKKHSSFFDESHHKIAQREKKIPGADRLETKDISKLYDHPGWKKGSDRCLSCAACTTLCPTCYCFEIHDSLSTDPKKGERKREWSSCQLQEFSKVAGGYVFRKDRTERFKHRIYHQLQYFKEKYGVDMCVGCGRCIEGCPTRIDFVELINKMHHEKKNH